MTTEQALRRLELLGFTIEDEPIKKAVSYMSDCLSGKNSIPDRRKKIHDWDVFTALILSAWIRRFTSDNTAANMNAEQWAAVVTAAFEKGAFDRKAYEIAYRDILRPSGGRLLNPANFYPVSLLNGCLNTEAEEAFVEWLITQEDGIYYIYGKHDLQAEAQSRRYQGDAGGYGARESGYGNKGLRAYSGRGSKSKCAEV